MPVSDADLRDCADLLATDFERCFFALTRHFQCLETAWQDEIERGREVVAAREVFVVRAEARWARRQDWRRTSAAARMRLEPFQTKP